jgi:pSer/pThr/pTyr-binding forkhead associated (FHA) protein
MASITISADGTDQKFTLEATTVTLGRGLESDIRLKDIKASRRHCQIVKTPQGFEVVDLSSGNGTFINGVQIKQHKLSPGDKIQIGSTTITFDDGNAAKTATAKLSASQAAKAKSGGTAVLPKAAAAPATTKSVPARTPTAQIPVAATKKMTVAVPAAKPGTQPIPTRPSTGSMPRASTTSLKKGTGRIPTGHTTRSAAKTSATAKFHADARRKKTNPIAILIGVIAVAFLGGLAFIFLGGGDDPEIIKAQLEEITKKAAADYDADRYDDAVAKYRQALDLIKGNDKYSSKVAMLKATITEVEERKKDRALADQAFQDFKKKFDTNAAPPRQLWDEGRKLQDAYAKAELPWKKDLAETLEKIDNLLKTESAINRRQDFQVRRNEIIKNCKLDDKKAAEWGSAIKAWKEYLEGKEGSKPSDDNRNKAENEVRGLQNRAHEDLEGLKKAAQRLVEDNKKADAVELLKQQRPRFEGTESAEDLEKVIKDLDK